MERLHMTYVRDLIHRLRAGDSERRIACDLGISRPTVHKYHEMAQAHGFLEAGSALPDDERERSSASRFLGLSGFPETGFVTFRNMQR